MFFLLFSRKDYARMVNLEGGIISEGIGIGKIKIISNEVNLNGSPFLTVEEEVERLDCAIEQCRSEIEGLKDKASKKLSQKEVSIFDAHLLFLHDPMLISETKKIIKRDKIKADKALKSRLAELESIFTEIPDILFRNRWTDLKDVGNRLLRILIRENLSQCDSGEKIIILSPEISPSDILNFSDHLEGIIITKDLSNSHSSILARALKIPMLLSQNALKELNDGDNIILDCQKGIIITSPDKNNLVEYGDKIKEINILINKILKPSPEETMTKDGIKITLLANIIHRGEIEDVIKVGAEGIGIYRTEFAYMNHLPSEDELYEEYAKIVEMLNPLPVAIRTLDLGADKWPKYMPHLIEQNPALGLRGIRHSLRNKDMLISQLLAIFRASAFGKAKIILPMVSILEDLKQTKKIIKDLSNINLPLGIMLETPSSILIAEHFAREVDFMSIGSNDLVQYTMAADRENEGMKEWYQSAHPAMLKFYKMAAEAGEKYNISTGICGEIGGDPAIVPILIGCGIKQLSMNPAKIPLVREKIRNTNYKEMKDLVEKIINT